jgi:hypothetical protein
MPQALKTRLGGDHLIFADYKKTYGTRGHEAKTLIIKKKSTPGYAIACLVWSQPHNVLRNGTKTDKNRGRKHASNPKTKENEPWGGTSASAGYLCTTVQSRGRGVDITEGSS